MMYNARIVLATPEVNRFPMLFDIKQGDESLTSHRGLALIGLLLQKTKIKERLNAVPLPEHPYPAIRHGDITQAMIGFLCLGQPDFADIETFRDDPFFRAALHLDCVPSEATLRQRLDSAHGAFDTILKDEAAGMIARHAPRITPCHKNLVPLDIDVSPFDNSGTRKEGVSRTYDGGQGYAPNFAYLGVEGYLINAELREGRQHGQKGTPAFLRESIVLARRVTAAPLLVRLDAGNHSQDNIAVCIEENVDWLIKRNLRQESKATWLAIARELGTASTPRPGKTVYRGAFAVAPEGYDHPARRVFEVTERTCDRNGQLFLEPEIEVATFDTSRPEAPDIIIAWYHAHGTSEQFHSEIKSDMDLERLPSGKFATNALVLLLGLVAFNCLRLCGQEALRDEGLPPADRAPVRKKVSRRRLRSVMQDLMYMACRVITHARRAGLSFGRGNAWYRVWRRLYLRFAAATG